MSVRSCAGSLLLPKFVFSMRLILEVSRRLWLLIVFDSSIVGSSPNGMFKINARMGVRIRTIGRGNKIQVYGTGQIIFSTAGSTTRWGWVLSFGAFAFFLFHSYLLSVSLDAGCWIRKIDGAWCRECPHFIFISDKISFSFSAQDDSFLSLGFLS